MKTTHIIILVLIAVAIAVIVQYSGDLSSYETIASAKERKGKHVSLIAKLDKTQPIIYDPIKDPNYLSFTAVDSLGGSVKVVYHSNMPTDMEKSERIVLQGKMTNDYFDCKTIVLKCPSKYKDDPKAMQRLQTSN
jgi:cytochrome c-type biogenesis protein CcmE